MISQERLKELLTYNPDTGLFTWNVSRPNGVKIGDNAGQRDQRGYGRVGLDGERYKLHRLSYLYYYGVIPNMLDHINGDTFDNRIENLRSCDAAENNLNRSHTKANKLKVKNVHQEPRSGKYIVQININGKQQYLGRFEDLELAELVATEGRNKYYGAFNWEIGKRCAR